MLEKNKNPDMIMALGTKIWYLEPHRSPINLEEILIHQNNICRYNGAIKWKLLRHSYLVYLLASKYTSCEITLACAVGHDFHESIVGDIVTSLKPLIGFKNLEAMWEAYVFDQLGLPVGDPDIYDIVKKADIEALVLESWYCRHPAADLFSERFKYELPPNEEDQLLILKADSISVEELKEKVQDIVSVGAYEYLMKERVNEPYTKCC